jgi:hypothetical protein
MAPAGGERRAVLFSPAVPLSSKSQEEISRFKTLLAANDVLCKELGAPHRARRPPRGAGHQGRRRRGPPCALPSLAAPHLHRLIRTAEVGNIIGLEHMKDALWPIKTTAPARRANPPFPCLSPCALCTSAGPQGPPPCLQLTLSSVKRQHRGGAPRGGGKRERGRAIGSSREPAAVRGGAAGARGVRGALRRPSPPPRPPPPHADRVPPTHAPTTPTSPTAPSPRGPALDRAPRRARGAGAPRQHGGGGREAQQLGSGVQAPSGGAGPDHAGPGTRPRGPQRSPPRAWWLTRPCRAPTSRRSWS